MSPASLIFFNSKSFGRNDGRLRFSAVNSITSRETCTNTSALVSYYYPTVPCVYIYIILIECLTSSLAFLLSVLLRVPCASIITLRMLKGALLFLSSLVHCRALFRFQFEYCGIPLFFLDIGFPVKRSICPLGLSSCYRPLYTVSCHLSWALPSLVSLYGRKSPLAACGLASCFSGGWWTIWKNLLWTTCWYLVVSMYIYIYWSIVC